MGGRSFGIRLTGVLSLLLVVLAGMPTWGQQVKLPRADAPLLLFGFEGSEGISAWNGLKCELTRENVSEGTQAITFNMPKYEPKDTVWPNIVMDWNNGKGYPTKDWSHYGKIALDAWVDGDEDAQLIIEFRDHAGESKWGQMLVLSPGKKNEIQIPTTDLAETDISNIEQIALFAAYSKNSHRFTMDNIRLLPGEKLPVAHFNLAYPNYRDTIFPNAKNIKLSATLQRDEYNVSASDLVLNTSVAAGKTHISRKTPLRGDSLTTSIPVRGIPAGPVILTAGILNRRTGERLLTRSWTLRKITQAEASALKVYVDEKNNTVVDGKPFFPLGFYNSMSEQYLDEIADSPFNCIMNYGTNLQPKEKMRRYLDKVQQKGLKIVYCMNDVYPTSTEFNDRSWEGVTGNDRIAGAVVDAYKGHPAILAWYLNDELPKSLAPRLEKYYQQVRNADPNHPCFIVLMTMSEVGHFPSTTDVMGVDIYPIPSRSVSTVSECADTATTAVQGNKPVWVVPQAFAWYQHDSSNPDRGHIPTADELRKGRAPSYEEERCMTYLALIHGAKGLIYWCYYDMRVLPQYDEMWKWMKEIGSEVKTLSPILLESEDLRQVKCRTNDGGEIQTKLMNYKGHLYLMAANQASKPCTVTFQTGKRLSGTAQVLFENRQVITDKTEISDTFQPLEVHVYDLGKPGR